jgi:hypothetical protein
MSLPPGCHLVCRPKRKAPRVFTSRKLVGIVAAVCREEGKEAVTTAVFAGLIKCEQGKHEKLCYVIELLIEVIDNWNESVGPVFDILDTIATAVRWLIELPQDAVKVLEAIGVKLPLLSKLARLADFIEARLEPGNLREGFRYIRDGTAKKGLEEIRSLLCEGFATGGGF